ncbi:MAG: Acylphosphate phosphohydrolase, putative [Candidatus Fermentimicrarchaeum limneticum]|uniref:Acylphosphatase n=1 Tax=Fermentimicrarchaeum limneticum TaxID=2795018 RepID=A0A7D5XJV3_FERL1|nr:MAG: Acylphosphate phosphohydrolase, putative [Candidatus Fermentimicrarchaeum limneticum]
MAKARLHAEVYGIVQGVFFRSSTEQEAFSLNLTGWVKNRRDGSVEIVAEGERDSLEALLGWCRKGPPGARVDRVDYSWEDFKEEFNSFSIAYG